MPGIVLSASQILTHLILLTTLVQTPINLILKPRYRDVTLLAQGHRDKKWWDKESTGLGCPKHLVVIGLTDLALTDSPKCFHVIL